MVENPADLPDALDGEPGYSLVRTLIFLAVYSALIIGAVVYLLRKLPRQDDTAPLDGEGLGDIEPD
jgi:hypothetical protein